MALAMHVISSSLSLASTSHQLARTSVPPSLALSSTTLCRHDTGHARHLAIVILPSSSCWRGRPRPMCHVVVVAAVVVLCIVVVVAAAVPRHCRRHFCRQCRHCCHALLSPPPPQSSSLWACLVVVVVVVLCCLCSVPLLSRCGSGYSHIIVVSAFPCHYHHLSIPLSSSSSSPVLSSSQSCASPGQ